MKVLPLETIGIIMAYCGKNDALTDELSNAGPSDGLANDLKKGTKRSWESFADYLRTHRDSFCGKIGEQLRISKKKHQIDEQIVQDTFAQAKIEIGNKYADFYAVRQMNDDSVQPFNPEKFPDCAFERIDTIAGEYPLHCDECIIECIKKNRPQLPEPEQENPQIGGLPPTT